MSYMSNLDIDEKVINFSSEFLIERRRNNVLLSRHY